MQYAVRPMGRSFRSALAKAVAFDTQESLLDYIASKSNGSLARDSLSFSTVKRRYDPRCGWHNWGFVLADRSAVSGYPDKKAIAIYGEIDGESVPAAAR